MEDQPHRAIPDRKFSDPSLTAKGEQRAVVELSNLETLWFNTGTLCNIECRNCYIESSPENDRLVYLTAAEVERFLDELPDSGWRVREIGFTGGEPFMNPEILEMIEAALNRGYDVLVLTNAMRPMNRIRMQVGLKEILMAHGHRLTLRVSLDHWSEALHDEERGAGSFEKTVEGMRWLGKEGFRMTVAGRTVWGESEEDARKGYEKFFRSEKFDIDAWNPADTVLFPEMDASVDVPEITTACWGILGKSPEQVMCSSSRMVVKGKGASRPTVVACTLLPYEPEFELGTTLAEAERPVALNHPHCAKFCVLGGASCSA